MKYMNEDFEDIFEKVKPIVLKIKRHYFIKLWTHDDWYQEGMLILYKLLKERPEVVADDTKLFIYFKTKFSNHIKDVLRKQESKKRRFNKMPYEEVGDIAHCLSDKGMLLDEYVMFHECLDQFKKSLDDSEQEKFERLIAGEKFAGRQALLKKLRISLNDFKEE
ncbi:ComX1, transcriptional regulator of competence-specific genes [Streptococcus macacae NCTC 11558]|nr:ComX1, transcriptional regulator of competence-specific genes [Streptococcus macacae NCTC 11558]